MTRKELVEALEANFKPDEVVTFEYSDGGYGITTETNVAVKDHTELFENGHWEYYDGDFHQWVKGSSPTVLRRWVPDGAISKVTRKVLYIGK
jgi:hypothetical protein